jgi:hypothetical protein
MDRRPQGLGSQDGRRLTSDILIDLNRCLHHANRISTFPWRRRPIYLTTHSMVSDGDPPISASRLMHTPRRDV